MGYHPVPATTTTVIRYAAFLCRSLKFSSVKQYLNTIRLLHLEWDLPNPLQGHFNLTCLLRGARRHLGDCLQPKRPITPELLKLIYSNLDLTSPIDANVWAISLIMFYGLLRKASVLPRSPTPTGDRHLCRQDVRFYPWGVVLVIRSTKTIQFQERQLEIPLPGMSGSMWCPVRALTRAMLFTPTAPGPSPAFLLPGRSTPAAVTGRLFDHRIRETLSREGCDPAGIMPHSWRRGGAQFAFSLGLSSETIRMLGDWRSSAYLRYLDTDKNKLFLAIQQFQQNLLLT